MKNASKKLEIAKRVAASVLFQAKIARLSIDIFDIHDARYNKTIIDER